MKTKKLLAALVALTLCAGPVRAAEPAPAATPPATARSTATPTATARSAATPTATARSTATATAAPPTAAPSSTSTEPPSASSAPTSTPPEGEPPAPTETPGASPSPAPAAETEDPAVRAEREALMREILDKLDAPVPAADGADQLKALGDLAALTGDEALAGYVQTRTQLLTAETGLAELTETLKVQLAADPRLGSLDGALEAGLRADFTLPELLAVLPDGAGELLAGAELESAADFPLCWLELKALAAEGAGEGEDPLAVLSPDDGRYIALRLLALAEENGLLADAAGAAACARTLMDGLAAAHSGYTPGELRRLNAASSAFAGAGKLAGAASADRLVVRGLDVRLTQAPISYNGHLLLALEDLAALLGGAVVDQPQSDGAVVQTAALVVELEKGSTAAYLNDARTELAAPALVFQGRVYVPAELLALALGRTAVTYPGVAGLVC